MTLTRTLLIKIYCLFTLFLMSGCASLNLEYTKPSVELTSFKVLPANGLEQKFEIGLKVMNPNSFALPFNGMSYQLNVLGETLAHGVTAKIPTAEAYGESSFVVPVATSLLGGIKVISALIKRQSTDIKYQFIAKLDIDIPFVPKLEVTEAGVIPLQ
ncbi:LEA type 2 family protein [Thalassotalea piscium]